MTQAVSLAQMGNGPAFSAYVGGAQSIAASTFVKLACNTKEFDTNSNYDTTLFRFTPTIPGYYIVTGEFILAVSSATILCSIFKNGAEFKRGAQSSGSTVSGQAGAVSAIVFMNGTTDFLELFVYQSSGATQNITTGSSAQSTNYFQACLIRGA